MTQVTQITATLKHCLRSRGITYAQLAQELRLSEASVKRLFSRGTFTLERLEEICGVLGMDFYDLARMARNETDLPSQLTVAQEDALARDPRLLTVFFLLRNGWELGQICQDYVIAEGEGLRLMAQLDRLRLIELQVGNRVKHLVARNLSWREGGPIRRTHQTRVLAEFFAADFNPPTEKLRFEVKELSQASLAVMQRKLDHLAAEFSDLAEMDASLPASGRQAIGLALAVRPWIFSILSALKKAP
jgi:DNA-binding Xre family transcriptional regulator